MIIKLSRNLSENNSLNKILNDTIEINGTLRAASSIINPSFTIESAANLSTYNYCEIPEFNRKYFINNIVVGTNNMWTFHCHVDVLTTYASDIRKQNAVIARQEWSYNLYLNDDKLLVECDRDIMTLGFNNPLSSASGGKSFVITVAGGTSQTE